MPFLDQRLVTWWVNYGRAQLRRDNSNSSRFHFPYSQNHQVRKRRTIKTGLVRHYFYHRLEKGRVYAPWANHLARKNMHLTPHTHTICQLVAVDSVNCERKDTPRSHPERPRECRRSTTQTRFLYWRARTISQSPSSRAPHVRLLLGSRIHPNTHKHTSLNVQFSCMRCLCKC